MIKRIILFFLLRSIYYLLIFIHPIKKIKVGRIYTSRIGHIAFNIDNYIYHVNKKGNKEITCFGIDDTIANKELLDLFKKNKNIYFSRFFYYMFEHIRCINRNSKFLVKYYPELHKNKSLLFKSKTNLNFTKNFIGESKKVIKKIGLSNNFITLHNRDNKYRLMRDQNIHEYRNFNFSVFKKAIIFNKKRIDFIRVGNSSKERDLLRITNLYKLEKKIFTKKLELYLISKSKFMISGNTGFLNVASAFRRPTLMLNTIPFNPEDFIARSQNSIIVPKKIYSIKKKRNLNLVEMINLKVSIHNKKNFFKDNKLIYIDNTSEEVLNSINEMILKLKDKKKYYKKYKIISTKFEKYLIKNNNNEFTFLKNKLSINISYEFLKKNLFLIR
jgi:putative glycosyltransferase (TIGR04372 family)